MTSHPGIARAHGAPGRLLLALATALAVVGCTRVGPDVEPAGPAAPPEPRIEEGPTSPAAEARAARLFRDARDAYEGGRWDEALAFTNRVVEAYARTAVSGRALRLGADAALAGGRWTDADRAAALYAELLPDGDQRLAALRLLQAEAMAGAGDPEARVRRLLLLPGALPPATLRTGLTAAREAAAELDVATLERVARDAPDAHPVATALRARLAWVLLGDGQVARAEDFARRVIESGATGADSLIAAGVLEGRGPELRVVRIASVLPTGGSPALRGFAERVAEGVEVAATEIAPAGVRVELVSRDDQGDPVLAADLVRELEGAEVLGAVGFLEDAALEAGAQARSAGLPLVSPTARTASGEGVFSLAGADPLAAVAVADYAARTGYARVAVIHSRALPSVEEADAFERTLTSRGVPVVGRFPYEVGATFFQEQIRGARDALRRAEILALGLGEDDTLHVDLLDPVAVFLPVPVEDVELLAPQVTFFGLDTLAIDVLGTSGWTDPATLDVVDARHTTGVVATAPANAGEGAPGYRRFRDAYEQHFQRTLVSPVPALGYDATLLLLEGIRGGARSPAQLRGALARVRGVEGATGTFTAAGGRILRRQEVVRIVDGVLIPTG